MNRWRFHQIIPAALLALVLAVSVQTTEGAFQEWTTTGEEAGPLMAELLRFDFEAKEIVCRDREGGEHHLATADLDTGSRMQILLSPVFLQGFPDDEWKPEVGRFILLSIAAPSFFLLISLYLCAAILLKRFNPLWALVGWAGCGLLGGFLVAFYVMMARKSPGSGLAIAIFGLLIVSVILAVFVSIIYRTTTMNGLKVLVLHLFGAFALMVITVLILNAVVPPDTMTALLERYVFIPVGLVAGGS